MRPEEIEWMGYTTTSNQLPAPSSENVVIDIVAPLDGIPVGCHCAKMLIKYYKWPQVALV